MEKFFLVLALALATAMRGQVGVLPADYTEAPNPYLYGLAFAQLAGQKYLVDADGTRYRLAESPDELNERTEAAILSQRVDNLDKYPNIKILIYRDVSHIPEQIAALQSLEVLDLSPNSGQAKPAPATLPHQFAQLQQLRILNLAGRNLSALPDWVGDLPKLQFLNLENNPIASLPASLAKSAELKKLKINYLQLQEIPVWAAAWLDNELNLVGDDFGKLPQGIGKLGGLERLALVNTQKNKPSGLKKLPAELRDLHKLRALVIVNQELITLPSFAATLPNLEILDLSGNALSSLPKEIEQATKLKFINLSHNPWKSLNSEIWKLRGLPIETLVLENLGLSELPPAVASLRQLKRLSLCGNNFSPNQEAEIRDLLFPCEVRFSSSGKISAMNN